MSTRKKVLIAGICLSVVVTVAAIVCAWIIYNNPEEIIWGPYIPDSLKDMLSDM